MNPVWSWETVDPNRSGAAGDLAKLFRSEHIKRPGIMRDQVEQSLDATVMAREVIQNSWDSARERRGQISVAPGGSHSGSAPDFVIEFDFHAPEIDAAERANERLGISELQDRYAQVPVTDRRALGVGDDTLLSGRMPLRVLRIAESGTTGMGGRWDDASSKMYLALVSIGFTEKRVGSGGSYGYGKAGLIRASRTRTVVAYSCFEPTEGDSGVTRRLLGMTYWGRHALEGRIHTGFARFGADTPDGNVQPFEDDKADALALELGIDLRTRGGEGASGLGTTFIVLDPGFGASDLRSAIEHNWWPAILSDQRFEVRIHEDGVPHPPDPEAVSRLSAFIAGYRLATGEADLQEDPHDVRSFNKLDIGGRQAQLGTSALIARPDDWSYPGADGIDHRSLVALIRSPRMVVEYLEAGTTRPFVRGAFLADPDVDDLLRQTEPMAHDAWEHSSTDPAVDPAAFLVAQTVSRRVEAHVKEFRASIRPPTPSSDDLRLPELERLFKDLLASDGTVEPPPPPGEPREISVKTSDELEAAADGRVRMSGSIGLQLNERVDDAATDVRVRIWASFQEDGRVGRSCPLVVELPRGFIQEGAHLRGRLTHDWTDFSFRTEPYEPSWTVEYGIEASRVVGEDAESDT